MTQQPNTLDDFWSRIDQSGDPDACWEWQGHRDSFGYGIFPYRAKLVRAHRLALELHLGRPLQHYALHTCDNRACCNHRHLYDGTQAQNVRDRDSRGRTNGHLRRGELNGRARLTADQVADIKTALECGVSAPSLARQYQVHPTTIQLIKSGRTWKEVMPR